MKNFMLAVVLCIGIGAPLFSNAAVWEDQKIWSQDWETKFSQWVAHDFKPDTFVVKEGNPLGFAIKTADIPYLAKALFAYENKLPFMIKSRANSRVWISNRSDAWDQLADGMPRLAQFLKDLRVHISLDRLALDSFPLNVSKDALTAGSYYLMYRSFTAPDAWPNSLFVKSVQEGTGFMTYVVATRAEQTRVLTERTLQITQQPSGASGFMALRWPNEKLDGLENHYALKDPRFSYTAQYQSDFTYDPASPRETFSVKIQKAIGDAIGDFDISQQLYQDVYDLCLQVRSRIDWVNESLEYLAVQRATNPGFVIEEKTAMWRLLSTPQRDAEIADHFALLRKKYRNTGISDADLNEQLTACEIAYGTGEGQKYTLKDYLGHVAGKRISGNPNHSLEARWGVSTALAL